MPQPALYRWNELATDRPMPLLERRRVIGERAMLSRVALRRGCEVPEHTHPNEQFACVLSGRMRFLVGYPGGRATREIVAEAGDVVFLPADAPHAVLALEDCVVIDVFSPPSATTGIDRPQDRPHDR